MKGEEVQTHLENIQAAVNTVNKLVTQAYNRGLLVDLMIETDLNSPLGRRPLELVKVGAASMVVNLPRG